VVSMRVLLVFCVAILSSTIGALAQVPGLKEDTAFRPAPSNANYWLEVVRNQGSSPLEAFFGSFICSSHSGGGPVVIYDSRFDYPGQKSIPPSGSVESVAADPSDCTGGIKAAIYSDGHVEGGSEELTQLFDRRKGAYEGLGEVIPLLNEVAEGQRTTPQLLNQLESLLAKGRTLRTPEAAGYDFVYVIARESWKQGGRLHVPSDDTRSRIPGVDDVMKTRGVSLDQARAIVLSQKLKEWRSALEGHTGDPGQS
jgi:hypothetical protein